jgi:CSLREA domain-containing protein
MSRGHLQWWAGPLFVLLGGATAALFASSLVGAPAGAQDIGSTSDSTFTVDSTADDPDADAEDGACATAANACTLRAAIAEANTRAGSDTIAFDIPGDGVQTIQLTKALPVLKDASGPTTIDGYTQPGSSPNTDLLVNNAVIKVEIKGTDHDPDVDGFIGLTITSSANAVRGLALYSFYRPLRLFGSGAHDNHIAGNFVGTDAASTYSAPYAQHGNGIQLSNGASNNTIGGALVAERNVISGNADHGVGMYNTGTNSNVVIGNLIGLDSSGTKRLSNKNHGVDINQGASNNVVGGTSQVERNVISGNGFHGVEVSHPDFSDPSNRKYSTGNQVIGNFIGTDPTGEKGPEYTSNGSRGVHFEDHAKSNVARNNVIGNNKGHGVLIAEPGTTDSQVYDNWIGISPGGAAIPNGHSDSYAGVAIESGAKGSRIGPGNVIANNPIGVLVSNDESDSNTITRNSIYGNTKLGIDISPLGAVNQNEAGDADTGANEQLNYPVLSSARKSRASKPAVVKGTACAGCTVEVFAADGGKGVYGEGKSFVGSVIAGSDGTFAVSVGVPRGRYVSATATDAEGNTSEFSRNLVVTRKR